MTLSRTEQERNELFIWEIVTIVVSIIVTVCVVAAAFVVLRFRLISRLRAMFSSGPESMLSQRQVQRPEAVSSSAPSSHTTETFSDSDSSDEDDGAIP
jgi:hypothetical protein